MNKKNILLKINKIINEKSFLENKDFLLSAIDDFDVRLYTVGKIPKQMENLKEVDFLWDFLIKDARPFGVLDIFKDSINENNAKYIIRFIHNHYSEIGAKFNDSLFKEEALRIVIDTLKTFPDLCNDANLFLMYILEFYSSSFKKVDYKSKIEQEKKLVAELLKTVYNSYSNENIKEKEVIVKKIWNYFDLVSDESEFSFYTSPQIFEVIKEFVDQDFLNNFPKVVKSIVKQYQSIDWYKNKFDGWELVGSGISQLGENFSIGDHRFIDFILKPSLLNFYRKYPDKGWNFILNNLISTNKKNVSLTKPDFLNRTAIPILIEEYSSNENNEKAFKILKSFISMRKGIPHKSDLIFQEIYNNQTISDDKKWKLVKAQLELPIYNNLPANVFVEKIASDLAQKGEQEVAKIVGSWAKNPDYRKRQRTGTFTVLENISKLLSNNDTFNEGLSSLKEYLLSAEFIKGLETFNAWDVSKAVANVLTKNTSEGISLLNTLFDLPTPTTNQQIVLCGALGELSKSNKELLLIVFNEFIKPKLQPLKNSQIRKKLTSNSARETLLSFNEKLAESKNFKEALWMVKKFLNDTDPPKNGLNDKEDPSGRFNRHRQIIEGSDMFSISTVRGWIAWVLQQFVVTGGEKYLTEVIDIVEKLSKDSNYYIRLQACFPLMALIRNRHTVLAKSGKRFMSLENAYRVENIAFAMLEDKENQNLYAIMKHLAIVFSYIRNLNTSKAVYVLEKFKNLNITIPEKDIKNKKDSFNETKDFTSKVIHEASSLFIYYAEFRKNAFKSEKNKKLYGEDVWEQILDFDDKPLKILLNSLLEDSRPAVKASFAWHFWRLPQEKGIDFNQAFTISYKYLATLTRSYSHPVFEDIYRFIDDNIPKKFEECFELWKMCLQEEKTYFESNIHSNNWQEMYWWPYFYNGKILSLVYDNAGTDEFLKWLGFLSDYPKKMLIANDLDIALNRLISLSKDNKKIENIFEKLIERNANYIDFQQRWKNQ